MGKTIQLAYLPKRIGGRLQHVAVFRTSCGEKANAKWTIDETVQSGEESSDEFAHVGKAQLSGKPVIVKFMLDGFVAQHERKLFHWWKDHPHVNIVQGLCEYSCKDDQLKWGSKVKKPTEFCNPSGKEDFVVLVQEFIKVGNLNGVQHWTLRLWKSVTLQLLFACMEWYESYGFLYNDWHFGNVLLDDSNGDTKHVYKAFNKKWVVDDLAGVRPVLTDFARCELRKHDQLEPWHLATQIAYVLNMMMRSCPDPALMAVVKTASIKIGDFETHEDVIKAVAKFIKFKN
jgi:hypothetical protein